MEYEEFDLAAIHGEFAAILRAILHRHGGVISIAPDELPTGLYSIGVDHTDDGGLEVYLHEGTMQ